MKQRVFRKSRSGNPSHTTITRLYRFDTLEIGDEIEVKDLRKRHSAQQAAYQYGRRTGKKFVTRTDWNEQHHRVLVVERAA